MQNRPKHSRANQQRTKQIFNQKTSTMKYKLKTSIYNNKVDVQKAGEYVSNKRNKRLSDLEIVEDNRIKGTPLHKIFTWDDQEAADKHRVIELRNFERQLVVVDSSEPNPKLQQRPAIVRVKESLVIEGGSDMRTVAVTINEVCSNDDMMRYVIDECKSELRATVRKFNKFTTLEKSLHKIQKVIEVM